MTVDEQLDKLAEALEPTQYQEGERSIRPDEGQSKESFQADVVRLRRWALEGKFEIRFEHIDRRTANRYVDSVRIRMGPKGVAWRKSLKS